MLASTDLLTNEDIKRIYESGNNRLRSRDINASNYTTLASADSQAGAGALVKDVFDMGSTVLGGVTQYSALKDTFGKKPVNLLAGAPYE